MGALSRDANGVALPRPSAPREQGAASGTGGAALTAFLTAATHPEELCTGILPRLGACKAFLSPHPPAAQHVPTGTATLQGGDSSGSIFCQGRAVLEQAIHPQTTPFTGSRGDVLCTESTGVSTKGQSEKQHKPEEAVQTPSILTLGRICKAPLPSESGKVSSISLPAEREVEQTGILFSHSCLSC